jgi:hypothetical protein
VQGRIWKYRTPSDIPLKHKRFKPNKLENMSQKQMSIEINTEGHQQATPFKYKERAS